MSKMTKTRRNREECGPGSIGTWDSKYKEWVFRDPSVGDLIVDHIVSDGDLVRLTSLKDHHPDWPVIVSEAWQRAASYGSLKRIKLLSVLETPQDVVQAAMETARLAGHWEVVAECVSAGAVGSMKAIFFENRCKKLKTCI
jgi:hypothetical protein